MKIVRYIHYWVSCSGCQKLFPIEVGIELLECHSFCILLKRTEYFTWRIWGCWINSRPTLSQQQCVWKINKCPYWTFCKSSLLITSWVGFCMYIFCRLRLPIIRHGWLVGDTIQAANCGHYRRACRLWIYSTLPIQGKVIPSTIS